MLLLLLLLLVTEWLDVPSCLDLPWSHVVMVFGEAEHAPGFPFVRHWMIWVGIGTSLDTTGLASAAHLEYFW